eukprot:4515693-Prymnesium_polylepis.1
MRPCRCATVLMWPCACAPVPVCDRVAVRPCGCAPVQLRPCGGAPEDVFGRVELHLLFLADDTEQVAQHNRLVLHLRAAHTGASL